MKVFLILGSLALLALPASDGALHAELRRPLAQSLSRYGLVLKQVRTFNYRHPVLDEQQKIKEELLLQATAQEAQNAGRKRLFEAMDEAEIQELAEQTRHAGSLFHAQGEKLGRVGAPGLGDNELLALVIGAGTPEAAEPV